jgi:hypothetical protein
MLKDMIFHKLGGCTRSGSYLPKNELLDVARIGTMQYGKRLIKIFDREYDYELFINYHKRSYEFGPSFGLTLKCIPVVTFTERMRSVQMIRQRYKYQIDIMREIEEIAEKQNKLTKYTTKIANRVMKNTE